MKNFLKKSAALLIAVCVFGSSIPIVLTANAEDSSDLIDLTAFTFDGDSVTVKEGSDLNYEVVVYDDTDTESNCSQSIDESGNTVYSLPEGSSGQILVSIKKKGGSYVFQGSGNGAIAVKKEATANSDLYLNGLTLTSSFTSALAVKKDSDAECIIHVVDSTINTLTDNARNNEDSNADNLAAENAVMKFKDGSNVTITESGTLNIVGNAKNGIKANNMLTIDGNLTLNITAPNNGINSENSITVNSGKITVNAGGDGIKASPDVDDTTVSTDTDLVGNILIEDGTFNITASNDGIQANNDLIIYDGEFNITCNGGYTTKLSSDADSCKGLKAGSYLTMYRGTYNINSADDAIHSDEYVYMIAGDFNIQSGDDGVHADTSLIIGEEDSLDDNLSIYISNSYEGLEGGTVYIYSGYIELTSNDDGINAAGGSSNGSGGSIGGDGFNPGGGGGMGPGGSGNLGPRGSRIGTIPGMSSSNDYSINIYGGNINVNAEGDGLDSNGSITITDGDILVFGAASNGSSRDNSALDWETTCVISGGLVLAAGSSQMAMAPSNGSQPYIIYKNTVSKGKAINILNGDGNPVYSTVAVKQVNHIIYSSAKTSDAYSFSITDEMLIKDPTVTSSQPTSQNNVTKGSANTSKKATSSITTTRSPSAVAKDKASAKKVMKQAKIKKLTVKSKAKKKIAVTWKKVKKAKGYEVQVSTSKKFKNSKIILKKFTSAKKLTIKNKKIKSGKTYFVRVRAYAAYKNKTGKDIKVYSAWNKKLRKVTAK